jgi:hypothetical protein
MHIIIFFFILLLITWDCNCRILHRRDFFGILSRLGVFSSDSRIAALALATRNRGCIRNHLVQTQSVS